MGIVHQPLMLLQHAFYRHQILNHQCAQLCPVVIAYKGQRIHRGQLIHKACCPDNIRHAQLVGILCIVEPGDQLCVEQGHFFKAAAMDHEVP